MQNKQARTLDAGRRVQGLLDKQAAAIGAAVTPSLRAKLNGAVTQLAGFELEQDLTTGGSKGETAAQTALREEIFQTLVLPVGTIARRALPNSADLPTLVVPASAQRRKDFATKVSNLADTAAKYESLLVEYGLPADFLAQLRAGVAQLVASDQARNDQLTRRSAATAGLSTSGQAVRDVIVVIGGRLSPLIKKDRSFAAGWQASSRIHQTVVTPMPTGGVITAPNGDAPPVTEPAAPPTPAAPQADGAIQPES